jgi:hypothetical protein
MIMAELRRKEAKRQKSESINQYLTSKEELFAPYRRKLKSERRKVPDPGNYHHDAPFIKKPCTNANFKSLTAKSTLFDPKKGKIPDPGHYNQYNNTIA